MPRQRTASKETFKEIYEKNNKNSQKTAKALKLSAITLYRYLREYNADESAAAKNTKKPNSPRVEKAQPLKLEVGIDLQVTVSNMAQVVKNLQEQGFNVKINANLTA